MKTIDADLLIKNLEFRIKIAQQRLKNADKDCAESEEERWFVRLETLQAVLSLVESLAREK